MSNPELDQGCVLNNEAAYCYKNTPHTYKQMVFDCVSASLRIEGLLRNLIFIYMTQYVPITLVLPHEAFVITLSYELFL